jgi:hypothetical protein
LETEDEVVKKIKGSRPALLENMPEDPRSKRLPEEAGVSFFKLWALTPLVESEINLAHLFK